MVLDALFIAVFKWGLAGAACVDLACCVGGFFPLWYFSSHRNKSSLRLLRTKLEWEPLAQASSNGLSECVGNGISWNVPVMSYNLQLPRMMGRTAWRPIRTLLYYGYIFAAVFFGFNIAVTPVIGYSTCAGRDKVGTGRAPAGIR